jgi:hypothetical protein
MAVATDKSSSGKATRFLLSPWLALVTFGILLCVKIADPFLIEATRLKFYDYVMMDQPIHSDQIVVANIDEEAKLSLAFMVAVLVSLGVRYSFQKVTDKVEMTLSQARSHNIR